MTTRLVLLPNLGAEDERPLFVVEPNLASGLARTWALLFDARATLDGGLPRERPPWLDDDDAALPFLSDLDGLVPWLSTREAESRARTLDLPFAGAASDVTRRVSDKEWALAVARELQLLPPTLHDALSAFSPDQLSAADARALVDERLERWPASLRESFTLKPRFGSSGRGRVKGRGGRLDDAGAAGLPRLARRGGAVLEPWLSRHEDLSAQLFVDDDGRAHLLGTTRQLTTPSGVWLGNVTLLDDRGALRSGSSHDDALRRAALLVGARAAREGFRGPLGLDAFTYLDADGQLAWRPLVEVNARFSMGHVTLGLARRAERAGHLRPRQACAFRGRVDDRAPPQATRLALPHGALDVSSDYASLASTLPAGGSPKRR